MSSFVHDIGDTYKVTGTLRTGARFRAMHMRNLRYALSINLWRGRVWQRKKGIGTWKCIKEVVN